jgi:hypothetical protein
MKNKNNPNDPMVIIGYKDMSEIPDSIFQQKVDNERNYWALGGLGGNEGYGEYLVCTNTRCRLLQTLEDVYGMSSKNIPLKELEANGPKIPDCPECRSPSELAIPREAFAQYLRAYLSAFYGSILITPQQVLKGHAEFFSSTRRGVIESMNYRNGYDMNAALTEINRRTGEAGATPEKNLNEDLPAVCFHRIGIEPDARGLDNSIRLSAAALDTHPEFDESVVLSDTRYDTASYPIIKAMGFEEIQEDSAGNIMVFFRRSGRFREILHLPREEFLRHFGKDLQEIRKWQESHLAGLNKPPKRYLGFPGIKELVAKAEFLAQSKAARVKQLHEYRKNLQLDISIATSEPHQSRIEIGDGLFIEQCFNADTESREMEPKLRELSDCFRWIFINSLGQYCFYPSEGKPISAHELMGVDRGEMIPLEALDSADLSRWPHPTTGELPVFWHDPEITFEAIRKKLHRKGQVSLLRDSSTQSLKGFVFGYFSTVAEAFEEEEWEHPHRYSAVKDPRFYRDPNHFIRKINQAIRQHPDRFKTEQVLVAESPVYVFNAWGLAPECRNKGVISQMLRYNMDRMPDVLKNRLIVLNEPSYNSFIHNVHRQAGAVDIPGALPSILTSPPPSDYPILVAVPYLGICNRFKGKK